MLNLEMRLEILGITVFQDTDRTNQFYYLPGQPHIAREAGAPLFDLFLYNKGGETGTTLSGGFLNLAVETGIGPLKDRIEGQLRERFGDEVTLASVPLTKGEVRVIALGEDSKALKGGVENETTPSGQPVVAPGPRFIQNILGSGRPALDANNRAIFSFSLSEEGAAFFMGALSGAIGARPVGVIYELEYVGLLPAYDLEITIDFKSSYEYMQSRFSLSTLIFKAEVDNIVEQLKRKESIKIKETARTLELSTPEAVRDRQNRIDQLVKDLATGALFQPALTPGQPKAAATTLTAADATASAGQPPALAALKGGIAPAVATGLSEAYKKQEMASKAAEQEAGGPAHPTPEEPAAGQADGGGAVALWNKLGRPQAAFALKTIRQEEQRTVTYSLSQVTAQKQTFAPQSFIRFLSSAAELRDRVHAIDLNHPFFQKITIDVSASGVDFAAEGLTQMTVQIRYGVRPDGTRPKESLEAILRSSEDRKSFTVFLDKELTQTYEYKLLADYRTDFGIGWKEPRLETGWIVTEDRSLRLHPALLGSVRRVAVQLAPNLPADVTEVHARLHYENPGRGVEDSATVRLKPGDDGQTVAIRMVDPADHYTAETRIFFADGTSQDLPPLRLPNPEADLDGSLIIVNAPRANRVDGDVILQDPLGELTSALVDLRLEQGGDILDSRSFEIVQALKPERFSVRLPQPTPVPVLSFRERRLYKDGGMEELPWKQSPSAEVRVGIPAERVKNVVVEWIGPDLSDIGVNVLVVDLEYKDPQGDAAFEQMTTILIRDDPATHRQEWKVRLPDAQARTYRWKLSVMMADGTENSTQLTDDTRDHLLLRMPQL